MNISVTEAGGGLMGLPSGTVCCSLLGMRIDEWSYDRAVPKVAREWADGNSRYVCFSNAHMTMTSHDDRSFQKIVNGADMVVSDGVPVVWATRCLGLKNQSRVDAPTMTLKLCEMAEKDGVAVGFYGSTPSVLNDLVAAIQRRFPKLNIAYSYSPPFRALTEAEDGEVVDAIAKSGTRILFVGLGCPKQEKWMAEHRGRVPATMLGIGWTFDVLSEHEHMAPRWIQNAGLEWLCRLIQNPKRYWRRTLLYPRFVTFALLQATGLVKWSLPPLPS